MINFVAKLILSVSLSFLVVIVLFGCADRVVYVKEKIGEPNLSIKLINEEH